MCADSPSSTRASAAACRVPQSGDPAPSRVVPPATGLPECPGWPPLRALQKADVHQLKRSPAMARRIQPILKRLPAMARQIQLLLGSTDTSRQLEYWHIHENDYSTDHAADHRHQQRFDQLGYPFDPARNFFIMEIADALHHFTHEARPFADPEHAIADSGGQSFRLHGGGNSFSLT